MLPVFLFSKGDKQLIYCILPIFIPIPIGVFNPFSFAHVGRNFSLLQIKYRAALSTDQVFDLEGEGEGEVKPKACSKDKTDIDKEQAHILDP